MRLLSDLAHITCLVSGSYASAMFHLSSLSEKYADQKFRAPAMIELTMVYLHTTIYTSIDDIVNNQPWANRIEAQRAPLSFPSGYMLAISSRKERKENDKFGLSLSMATLKRPRTGPYVSA
jgi:hypothetical protein